MTYAEVLERFYETTQMQHGEYLELCTDFDKWRLESGPDFFYEQRDRILLIAVKFQEGGVNLWLSQIRSSYDWEDAAMDDRIQMRAAQVKQFLDQQQPGPRPETKVIAAALRMGPEYVAESLEYLASEGGRHRVADAPQ